MIPKLTEAHERLRHHQITTSEAPRDLTPEQRRELADMIPLAELVIEMGNRSILAPLFWSPERESVDRGLCGF